MLEAIGRVLRARGGVCCGHLERAGFGPREARLAVAVVVERVFRSLQEGRLELTTMARELEREGLEAELDVARVAARTGLPSDRVRKALRQVVRRLVESLPSALWRNGTLSCGTRAEPRPWLLAPAREAEGRGRRVGGAGGRRGVLACRRARLSLARRRPDRSASG